MVCLARGTRLEQLIRRGFVLECFEVSPWEVIHSRMVLAFLLQEFNIIAGIDRSVQEDVVSIENDLHSSGGKVGRQSSLKIIKRSSLRMEP